MTTADLILYQAKGLADEVLAVAIKGNKILAVSDELSVRQFKGNKTELINCQGKTLLPGFNDAHCHPIAFATSLLGVDCHTARSIAEIQSLIRQRAGELPPGTWVRANGYNEFYLAEKRHPHRDDLDRAVPSHPVKLVHRSGHACVLNSLGMQLVGISSTTPEPPGGLIERDLKSGEPNGLFFEMNTYMDERIPPLSETEMEKGMALADQQYLSYGVTSLQDASWNNSLGRWQIWQKAKESGRFLPRVSMMVGVDEWKEFLGDNRQFCGIENQLRSGAVKIVLDRTTGRLNPSQEELESWLLKLHQAGFQAAIHTVEIATLEAAITALEKAQQQFPKPEQRHRLEHASVCPPHLIRRVKNLHLIVVTQPSFIYYHGERYLATVPEDELRWLYPIGSLFRQGIKLAGSSDSPVVPPNPMVGIYSAITRRAETGQVISPEEGIPLSEAIEMSTDGGAFASFEEKVKGSLSPGKLADLIVLSENIAQIQASKIKDVQVMMTIIDGKVVAESLSPS
jgi:hypothetical protein